MMRIGIDDTDSPAGMCTTYLGALLVEALLSSGFIVKCPLLVRLNPTVPYKTRGNAAICIPAEGDPKEAFELACRLVEKYAEKDCEMTNPGVVVSTSPLPPTFYEKAVRDFCTITGAESILEKSGALYAGWKNRRGLIGAAAAVAAVPDSTWTREILVYRSHESKGPRHVDEASVYAADDATWPHTWDSVDRECGCVVCVPGTPDPVLFGIRGESEEWVVKGRSHIVSESPVIEQVFLTNQGTDAHLIEGCSIAGAEEGRSYMLSGSVVTIPETKRGGHVSVEIADASGQIRCMAYEPTKGFRDVIRGLRPGDGVLACGSIRKGSLNLEKIRIDSLAPAYTVRPPLCPACKKRMTSAGRGSGYKCRICSNRIKEPEVQREERTLTAGWYEVPPSARRHLAMPLVRTRGKSSIPDAVPFTVIADQDQPDLQ